MTTPTYAVEADCWGSGSWTGTTAPSNAAALLRTANMLVRDTTATLVYSADSSTGLPTDTDLLQAFQDATCAHAAALEAAGVNPLAAGTTPTIASTGIGSANVSYAGAQATAEARQRLTTQLCTEALMILRAAGALACAPAVSREVTGGYVTTSQER